MTAICRHTVLPIVLNGVPAPVQRRCLARSTVEVMAKHLIQTVIQLSKAKKKPVHQNQPRRRFRSAEASLMYRPCILQAPRGLLPICVIQLTHLHGSIVYHIEPMFVNRILVNFYKCHNSSVTRGSIPDFLDGTPFDFTTKLTEVYHVQLHLPYLFLNFVDDLSLKFRS